MISRIRFALLWSSLTTLAWIIGLTILFGWLTTGGYEWFYARDGLAFAVGIVIMAVLIGLAQMVALRRVTDGACPNFPFNWHALYKRPTGLN